MKPDSGNLLHPLPDATATEIFTRLACTENIRIERIVSKGQTSPSSGWYDQEEHELVVVLQGEAKLALASGDSMLLTSGAYVHIPAHTKHRVEWTTPDIETVWLAVYYR